jgi:hypothetical protein
MSGRVYSAVFEIVTVTAIQDLFEVVAPSDAAVIVHSVTITQHTDAGDAEAEMLPILIHRGTATGSGGTTVTPSPLQLGEAAFGGVVEANNTAQSVEGTFLHAEAFNVQIGFYYLPPPEDRPVISPSGLFIVELQVAPNDTMDMNGTIVFEEVGG